LHWWDANHPSKFFQPASLSLLAEFHAFLDDPKYFQTFEMKKIKGQLYPRGRHIKFECLYAKQRSNRSIADLTVPDFLELFTFLRTGNIKGNVERLT